MSSIILYERIINKRERKMHAMIYFIENFDLGTILFFCSIHHYIQNYVK